MANSIHKLMNNKLVILLFSMAVLVGLVYATVQLIHYVQGKFFAKHSNQIVKKATNSAGNAAKNVANNAIKGSNMANSNAKNAIVQANSNATKAIVKATNAEKMAVKALTSNTIKPYTTTKKAVTLQNSDLHGYKNGNSNAGIPLSNDYRFKNGYAKKMNNSNKIPRPSMEQNSSWDNVSNWPVSI